MQIRHFRVENFRGMVTPDRDFGAAFCCLIVPGDGGKSTVLDAIEAVISVGCSRSRSPCANSPFANLRPPRRHR